MNYTAVIFDLDGTLLDSMPYYAMSWQQAFRELHQVEIECGAAYQREGAQAEQFVRDIGLEYLGRQLDADGIAEAYLLQQRIFDSVFEPRFFPGAEELVLLPHRFGIPVGLVSGSKRAEIVRKTASAPKFRDAFDVIVAGEDTVFGKPSPEPFLRACAELKCDPTRTLVIENAPLGLQAAVAAGSECWIVDNSSPIGTAWAQPHGASRIAFDLREVYAALELAL